jgi:phosphohistidine phosphatase SixA
MFWIPTPRTFDRRRVFAFTIVFAVLAFIVPRQAAASETMWSALREGTAFAIMRHAIAPGTGDPDHFKLGDCSTQRNLSDGGRDQAKRIGEKFRANGLETAEVYSSQWCRCEDTAELLDIGTVQALPALNSFFQDMGEREAQTAALKKWLLARQSSKPLVLVTHQVNITALTGVFPRSGETVVAQIDGGGEVKVIGTFE